MRIRIVYGASILLIFDQFVHYLLAPILLTYFFFNHPEPTEIYTLSLHDALPISGRQLVGRSKTAPRQARCGCRSHLSADRKSTRLNSSHVEISYAVFCLKKKTRAPGTAPGSLCRSRTSSSHPNPPSSASFSLSRL